MDQLFRLAEKIVTDANGDVYDKPITREHLKNIIAHNHLDQRQHDAQVVTGPLYRKAHEHQLEIQARQKPQ